MTKIAAMISEDGEGKLHVQFGSVDMGGKATKAELKVAHSLYCALKSALESAMKEAGGGVMRDIDLRKKR